MGLAVDRDQFDEEDYGLFEERLRQNLLALKLLLEQRHFGRGPTTLGAELEVSIVDGNYRALPINRQALRRSLDPHLQLELDRFNLEFNLDPTSTAGQPFSVIEDQLDRAINRLNQLVLPLGGRVVPIGILPTLSIDELQADAITDMPRFRALNKGIRRLRQAPFELRIDGDEPLSLSCDAVSLEGANTSFQIHLRVNPAEFADTYNAAQLATPIALSVAANSPSYVGHLLWDETRVALFKQAIDSRTQNPADWQRAARVPFGHGWLRRSALENFAESVALHPCILPVLSKQKDPVAAVKRGEIPLLHELRLHQGTVWQWNRAIYDPSAGGHLRIEMRALPGGPTPVDMAANTAFLVGLAIGLRQEIDDFLPKFPFKYADYNFYRAAQYGLDAQLLWPSAGGKSPREISACKLAEDMLPVARTGLDTLGVSDEDSDRMLGVISNRLQHRVSAARWQRKVLAQLDTRMSRPEALKRLLQLYLDCAETRKPVSEWHSRVS